MWAIEGRLVSWLAVLERNSIRFPAYAGRFWCQNSVATVQAAFR